MSAESMPNTHRGPLEQQMSIHASGLSIYAPNGEQLLQDVSVDIHQGDFVSIIGQSGAGKTLLATTLLGLRDSAKKRLGRKPTGLRYEGTIGYELSKFDGNYTTDLPHDYPVRKHYIGYVPQQAILDDGMTVRDSILQPSRLKGLDVDPEWIDEISESLAIAELLGHGALNLSGGQKQRIAIARGLAHKPLAVVLDEPTAALNGELKEETNVMLKEIVDATGTTIITVTHDATLATRCIEMVDGKKVYDGLAADRPASKDDTMQL